MSAMDATCLPLPEESRLIGEKPSLFRLLWNWIVLCGQKRRGRLALSEMSPEQLMDIGIAPEDARKEAVRPFWN